MPGPHPAVALTRRVVRQTLNHLLVPDDSITFGHAPQPGPLLVAVSGGADSLALAAAVAFEAPKLGFTAHVLIVDHGLQTGSADVARTAAQQCIDGLGYSPEHVRMTQVEVGETSAGLEADARRARYAALRQRADELGAQRIMLGHTGNDQAEQVLLGLMRGSGTRSLAGMRVDTRGLLRPFLTDGQLVNGAPVMRDDTEQACAALGLKPWRDPHNTSDAFARVRARKVLAMLENDLGTHGITKNLIRTAASAARDADYLDAETDAALAAIAGTPKANEWPPTWPVEALASLPSALRLRALRRLLVLHGAKDSELASHHIYEVERLLVNWRGQGPIQVPGNVQVHRGGGEVAITALGKPQ